MYLKRVSVSGFKSFADRVDFEFSRGVTCVVGPNGCGKSNVVDAVKWVLGEQSARSLRGRQMADMIFNGSATRKSSSLAQVDLVFDNTDHTLPTDQTEVTVTRRLYRSGESEYLLNGGASRLKDIRELFLDTGVGVEAYSIIEQGRVDGLLQSNPVERRIIFEEAAGVSKYKARKKEAERKLERTQQNLLRVNDIFEELEKRLRSVKLQAGKARSYKEYEARLAELRLTFSLAEFHKFTRKLAELGREVDARADRVTALRTEIDRCEAEESRLTVELDRLAERISTADNELGRARSDSATNEQRIDAALQRAEEQRRQIERANERLVTEEQRLASANRELDTVQEGAHALQQETHELSQHIHELNEEDRALARQLTDAQATLEDDKAGIIDLLRRSAQLHNEITRLKTHRESLEDQQGRLAVRDAEITTQMQDHITRREALSLRIAEIARLIEQESETLESKKAEARRVDAERQVLLERQMTAKEQRSAMVSRRDVLRELQRTMDGVGAAARQLLTDKQRATGDEYEPVIGLVADIFDAQVEHARIIEAALGGWEQCVVLRNAAVLAERPEWFASLPGRLTVVCLDRLPPVINARDFSEQPGFVACSLDIVRFTAEFDHLARHLLAKTIVVSDRASALALAAIDTHGHRFVTTDGEVVHADGRVAVGPLNGGSGLISRRSELHDLDARLKEIDEQLAALSEQLDRAQAEAAHLDAVQHDLRAAIYDANTARVEATAACNTVNETVERLTHERPLVAQEVALLTQQIQEVVRKSELGDQSLEVMNHENRERESRIAGHQQTIDALSAARHQVQERLTESRVRAGQLHEKRAAAAETINGLRRAIRDAELSVANTQGDIAQCRARIAESEAMVEESRARLDELGQEIRRLDSQANELRGRRDTFRVEQERLAQSVRAARSELSTVEEQLNEHRLALTETTVRRDELSARVQEEMGMSLAERYESYQHADQDWDAVEAEIAELRGKIARLGNVNLDAIQELEELEQRHSFLDTQRTDLTESMRQLTELIERLNAESRERFLATFEQIREHFRAMFRKLFGGGRADVILENTEDPLETGIEIVAQPPGKDLQGISLMSGGEKSMTAIALLMSIFKCRPAPFAILDEVDAALDEANNERFTRIVKEFVTQSQFLVITHSKRTMGIADQLYGITMQEPGVSTRVSVRLSEVSAA